MKPAITGSGSVGKTTLNALLMPTRADPGRDILAVDAGPGSCPSGPWDFPPELRAILPPIAEAKFLEAGMPGVPLPDELLTDLKVREADGPGDPVYDQVESMRVAARRRLRYA